MPELNGETGLLYKQLKGDIDNIVEMERERWEIHDRNAAEFRTDVKSDFAELTKAIQIDSSSRVSGVTIQTVLGVGAFLLTIITFIAITMNAQIKYTHQFMDSNFNRTMSELVKIEARNTINDSKMDEKLQIEIRRSDIKLQSEIERTQARLNKLERLGMMYAEESLGDIEVLQAQSNMFQRILGEAMGR